MNRRLIRDRLRDILARIPEVRLGYLFGSQVDGPVGPLSDHDLGVWVEQGLDTPQFCARLGYDLAQVLEARQVDLVVLNRAPVELAYAIIAQGELLYEYDVVTRVEYEAQVMSLYADHMY